MAVGATAITAWISLTGLGSTSLRVVAIGPEASSAASSVIAGNPSQWVFGLEAQGDWADLSNQRVSLLDPTLSTRTKTSGIGLFTGQIGYAWNASLLYVKGGAAVTDNRFSILDTPSGVELAAQSATRWGAALGVGWEYGFAPNWSAGIEYDHLFMGHANNSFTATDPRLVGFLNDRITQDVDMLTLRINYRFGGYGSPVVAKY